MIFCFYNSNAWWNDFIKGYLIEILAMWWFEIYAFYDEKIEACVILLLNIIMLGIQR